jgi:hypothetical protein
LAGDHPRAYEDTVHQSDTPQFFPFFLNFATLLFIVIHNKYRSLEELRRDSISSLARTQSETAKCTNTLHGTQLYWTLGRPSHPHEAQKHSQEERPLSRLHLSVIVVTLLVNESDDHPRVPLLQPTPKPM